MRKRQHRPADPGPVPSRLLEYGPRRSSLIDAEPTRGQDPELWRVYDAFTRTPEAIPVVGEVVRDTFDQIYDGQWTGRWDFRQLNKTEKTHVGTLVQINLHKELELSDGDELDYKIAGVEVDCKWSMTMGGWEIPEEMYKSHGPQVALVVWGNDYTRKWAAGLVRTSEATLRPPSRQRDRKRRLNEAGIDQIVWLESGGTLLPNTLLELSPDQRQRILNHRSGQACVNALFYELPGRLVDRATVLTAAMQADSLKRVRDARKHLRPRGIVIFGHYSPHPELAAQLQLPEPALGSFVSARLAPAAASDPEPRITLQGRQWRLARHGEPEREAPSLPEQGRAREPAPVTLQ